MEDNPKKKNCSISNGLGSEEVVNWIDEMNNTTKKGAKSKTDLGIRPSQNRETPDFSPSRPFKESTFLNRDRLKKIHKPSHPSQQPPAGPVSQTSALARLPQTRKQTQATCSSTRCPRQHQPQYFPWVINASRILKKAHIFRVYPQCRPYLARTTKNSAWCLPGPSARHGFPKSF